MPDYRKATRRAARKHGLDPDIFERQIGAESGFNPNAGSPAGARGIAQIMPGTAKSWGVNLNDNRVSDDLDAAAKNMRAYVKKYGSYENALRAYNAGPGAIQASKGYGETNAYVHKILQGKNPKATEFLDQLSDSGGGSGSDRSRVYSRQESDTTFDSEAYEDQRRKSVLGQLIGKRNPNSVLLRLGVVGGERPDAKDFFKTTTRTVRDRVKVESGGSQAASQPRGKRGKGTFKVTGPNPGRLKPYLRSFAEEVAGVYGKPLTGSDGTGHSYRSATGNVSQHSTGEATDIPASGKELLRMGRAALIAAGMPRAQAMKAQGGLYNVGGHQIIFHDRQQVSGSPHDDHLHISAKPRRR